MPLLHDSGIILVLFYWSLQTFIFIIHNSMVNVSQKFVCVQYKYQAIPLHAQVNISLSNHREHTILLSRERVNKERKK